MTDSRRELGTEGELRAAHYLQRRGYRIAGRNVRTGGVELDLVATRGRRVVFVEVKTRRSSRYGPAAAAVDAPWNASRRSRSLPCTSQTFSPYWPPQ